ncbi:FMN-binding glutamate synthase family protein [Parasedimentitalea marina]|uniref:FMN-binding glutamate synthase family protein n=1 Tax=Parasedimentitalea marina TaxID=2483033 RepID=A0A3T0N131_9RHOB|nr:FMN-binding glutamate synthase family protein [Parasedimentitalea marina]AZV77707.1 FMN-binding glutamate synthase family protein [Parasedimentitalea marina]
MSEISNVVLSLLELLSYAFIFAVGAGVLWIVVLYIRDKTQTESTLRRNYPVVARFRYFFEHMGEFFRQYFFAQDREEMPFNRAERSWVYRAAKNVDSTVAFGSTRDLRPTGTVYFVNCPFPTLEQDAKEPSETMVGPYARQPYTTDSIFNISGMSYGAISVPAVRALAAGAKKAGIWINTGEGGLSPYHLESGADIVFQIGTGKFGVRKPKGGFDEDKLRAVAAHDAVRMFEIKLSQGAKPGKGGILPGAKVTKDIATIRGLDVGKDAISPNRHPEINSVDDLLDMISYVRNVTGKPVGFKAVIGAYGFFDSLCKEIMLRGPKSAPDFVTIDSADGGTGAAPMSLIDNMGMPLRESLPLAVDILTKYGLRDRVKICASGKLINPSEVAWAFCAGADFVKSARGFMFALGCIQALQCNKNTCPTGITTHNSKLQFGLDPTSKSERVANYAKNMKKEISVIAHSCGVAEPRLLKRYHARIVLDNGRSVSMDELFQEPERVQAAE